MFDRKTMIIIFWGYTFLYLPPYNSNFRYFEIQGLHIYEIQLYKDSNIQNLLF